MTGVDMVCGEEDRINGDGGGGPAPITGGLLELVELVTKLFCSSEGPRGLRCGRFPALVPTNGSRWFSLFSGLPLLLVFTL